MLNGVIYKNRSELTVCKPGEWTNPQYCLVIIDTKISYYYRLNPAGQNYPNCDYSYITPDENDLSQII